MKHGDKKKGKASKASGKKARSPRKAGKAASSAKAKSGRTKTSPKTGGKSQGGDGGARARSGAEITFSNPVVAAAFKHAVRKYPNAFRKLTD